MKRWIFGMAGLAGVCAAVPAMAQSVYGQPQNPYDYVTVNPGAVRGPLLYPGGAFARTPDQPTADAGIIRLRPPGTRRPARAVAAPVTPEPPRAAVAAPARPAPRAAATQAPPAPTAPVQTAKASPAPAASPAGVPGTGADKRSVILFAADQSEPAPSATDAIKILASSLAGSVTSSTGRVQLLAYGGKRGDKSTDARRLTLRRALAIRSLLIADGVPSERIDVRAMGGADDGGPADRVDVFVRA